MRLASTRLVDTPPGTTMFGRIIGVTVLASLGALTLAHPSATRMYTWPWSLLAALLWLLPLALVIRDVAGVTWRRPSVVTTAGLAVLAGASIASAWFSPFASTSLAHALPVLGGVATYFALHHWISNPAPPAVSARIERCAMIVATAGALVIATSLVTWIRIRAGAGGPVRNVIPFGHSTYTAGFVLLVLPWFAARAWHGRGWRRVAWGAIALAALAVLGSTSSRGAVAALVVVALAGASAAMAFSRWTLATKLLAVLTALAIAASATLTNPRLRELALRGAWGESAAESNRQRSAMLAAGAELGKQRPLLGWGAGTVPLAYPRVRWLLDGGVENVLQLHSTPLQLWATTGLAGVLAAALLIGGLSAAGAAALRQRGDRTHVIAASASLGGYFLFALTDHQLELPIMAAAVAMNAAVLTAEARSISAPLTRRGRMLVFGSIIVLASGPVAAQLRELRARHAFEDALVAWEAGRSREFLAALDRAIARAPQDPFYQHQAAGELLRVRDDERDPAKRRALTVEAVARLEASVRTGAHEEYAHFNLGWLRLELGEPLLAARHFTAALRLVPDKGGAYFGLGLALQAAQRPEDAVRAFALEWISDPRSMTSPAWETPGLAVLRPAVEAEVAKLYPALRAAYPAVALAEAWTRWWLGEPASSTKLVGGFTGEAARFAAALPLIADRAPVASANPGDRWAEVYRAWRQPEDAGGFAAAARGDADLAAALQRRAARHAADFRAFLSAPTGDEPALVTTLRRARTGYGVLAYHPDGPVLTDVYVVQENRVTSTFAARLFPPKGWLPGRFLLALLPADPR